MYEIIIKEIKVEDKKINTYGIAYTKDGVILNEIDDISLHHDDVQKLADSFNDNDLSPLHLNDVVEDFLNDPDYEG